MYLTKKQREVYNYISHFLRRKGYSPSLEEVGMGVGLSSLATVHKHLKNLEKKGVIRRTINRGRSIEITGFFDYPNSVDLPLLGIVSAGRPIEAVEDNQMISVPQDFIYGKETFVLKVKGDSMIDEQIQDGDFVVVERKNSADNGDTVVVLVRGEEATIKKFYREGDRIILQPANPQMKPMFYNEKDLEVKGVVIALMRKYF